MKKLIKASFLLTAFIMCFNFCGCNSNDNSNFKEEVITEEATEPTIEATTESPIEEYVLDSEYTINDITFKVSSDWQFKEGTDSYVYYWYTNSGNFIVASCNTANNYNFDADNQREYLNGLEESGCEILKSENVTLPNINNNALKIRSKTQGVTFTDYAFLLNDQLYSIGGTEDVGDSEGNLNYIEKVIDSIQINESLTELPVEKETDASTEAPTEKSIPKEYSNALTKAEIYSDTMYMSKAAIHDQLTSEYGEGFSEEAADYAIENLVADYKANALQKAHTYQDTMAMSKNAIYDQLISEYGEQFTEEEAQYAIDNLE